MLHEFVTANRGELIVRTRAKVAKRSAPKPTTEELERGVPLFLDQLVAVLKRTIDETVAEASDTEAIGSSGASHGGDLMRSGFSIAQVVHDYGDICQAVTELAVERHASISTDEFHDLNRCLDDAIAGAVTEFSRLRQSKQSNDETERLGVLAHEMRNKLSAATLAFATMRSGMVGVGGSTAAVLERNLDGLRDLIDRSLAEVRIESGLHSHDRVSVSALVEEVEIDAFLLANSCGIELTVGPVPDGLDIEGDRPILAAAVTNLLQNAFKFSRSHGHVTLSTSATAERVTLDIQDECGGLPPGGGEALFRPFTQGAANREGLGLGLSIARRGIESHGGAIRVRDLPGKGCIFSIELPRMAPAQLVR